MMSTQLISIQSSTLEETGFGASVTIQQSDLVRLLASHSGNVNFEQALSRISNGSELLHTLSSYIYFNSIFACGVANLAGEIGSRQHLFTDPNEPLAMAADRSIDVGARMIAHRQRHGGGREFVAFRLAHLVMRAVGGDDNGRMVRQARHFVKYFAAQVDEFHRFLRLCAPSGARAWNLRQGISFLGREYSRGEDVFLTEAADGNHPAHHPGSARDRRPADLAV